MNGAGGKPWPAGVPGLGMAIVLAAILIALAGPILPLEGRVLAAEVRIEATRFTFDREHNRYSYQDGRLTVDTLTVFATRMEVDAAKGVVVASGFIRLETPHLFGSAESMILDSGSRTTVFTGAHLFDSANGLFIEGEEVTLMEDGRVRIRSCNFTTCNSDVWVPWSLSATELTLRPNDVAVAWNPTLFIGPAPVFWLPFIAWPTVRERRSGVLPPIIARDTSSLKRLDLGYRLKVPVFVNLDVDHDLTLVPELIENREGALGLEYNYAFRAGQTGQLTVFGLREGKPRDPEEENDFLLPGQAAQRDPRPQRFLVDWSHNEALPGAARAVLSYHHSSDGQVRREYQRVSEYRPFQTYQATLSNQTRWSDAAFTYEQNADFLFESIYADDSGSTDLNRRPQLLPRLSAHFGGRIADGFPLALALDVSGARFVAPEAVGGRLGVASPGITLPLALGGAFELRMSVRRHFVTYRALTGFNPGPGQERLPDESFAQGEGEVEMRTVLARTFSQEKGRFTAVRHRITPRLIYREIEDVAQPLTDQVLRARVALRMAVLRLDNTLLARTRSTAGGGSATVSELVRFNLIQRYNFLQESDAEPLIGPGFDREQETARGEPRLPLILEIMAGNTGSNLTTMFHYHHQRDRITRAEISWNGAAGTHARLGIGYSFNEFTHLTPDNKLVPATNAFTFTGETALTERLSLGFEGRLNLQDAPPPLDKRIDRSLLFLDYHPVCYAVRLSVEETVASVLENGAETFFVDRKFSLSFNLLGLVGGRAGPARNGEGEPRPPASAGIAATGGSVPARCNT